VRWVVPWRQQLGCEKRLRRREHQLRASEPSCQSYRGDLSLPFDVEGASNDWAWETIFFGRPSLVAALLWFGGAAAGLQTLLMHRWSGTSVLLLEALGSLAGACGILRATVGDRLPKWTFHVDVVLANALVSVGAAVAAGADVDLGNLYLLVEVFALLYLPLRPALAHLALAAIAYAVVLGIGPSLQEPALLAWFAVFGTATVLGVVVFGLTAALRSRAEQDPLTKLANRRGWEERLATSIDRAARSGSALSVVMLDLDGFKEVNDAFGHLAGDRLLQAVAATWRAMTRGGGDFLARLGGDEFGLIAMGADEAAALCVAQRLVEVIPGAVSASFGVATWDGAESASALVRRADHSMYHAKRSRQETKPLRVLRWQRRAEASDVDQHAASSAMEAAGPP
jgi:diguanylate cyclase (GGDEF)-like protein